MVGAWHPIKHFTQKRGCPKSIAFGHLFSCIKKQRLPHSDASKCCPMSTSVPGEASRELHQREQALATGDDLGIRIRAEDPERVVDAAGARVPEFPPGSCLASLRRAAAIGRRLDGAPDLLCGVWHVEVADAQRAERIDHRIRYGSGGCDRAGLADALDAEWVDRRRGHRLIQLEGRQPRRPRERVVHHRAREQLAVVAVDRAFPQRLADPLGDAAVELAVDDHRVDLLADIVHGDIANQVHHPRLLVDLDEGHVGPERECAVGRVVVGRLVEVRLHVHRRIEREVQRERDLLDRLDLVRRALDTIARAVDLDVLRVRLQHVGGVAPGLLADLAGRLDRGAGAHVRRAAAVRAVAERRALGIRVLDDDVLHRDAQLVADDLGVRRLVALALRLGADGDDGLAGQVDLDVGGLPHRGAPALADGADPLAGRDAADLDVGAEADAEELAALLRLGLLPGHVGVARHRERLVHGRLVITRIDVQLAAVDRGQQPRRVVVGEAVGRQEVTPAELCGVHAQLVREQVHRALDDVRRLGPARTTVGVHERGVGVDAGDLTVDVGDLVRARQDPPVQGRRDAWSDGRQAAPRLANVLTRRPLTSPALVAAIST